VLSNFTSETASSGLEALEKISDRFDVVLLDLTLPDMDGVLLLKHLRTSLGAAVVVVSQLSSQEEKIAAWDAGAEDVISTPFVPAELLARLRAVLRRQVTQDRPAIAGRQG